MIKSKTFGIVGGGVLGLTLALRLAQKGYKVSVFEASQNVGGLAVPWKFGDITWDKFYHVILMSDFYLRNLLKDIGIENEMVWKETKTGFYTNGELYSMSNTIEFLKFPPLNIFDKFRLGCTIFYASKVSDWKKLEQISVENWLTKLSGKRTFNKMWLPLLKAKLGESYKEASAAFIWSTIQRMYAARNSGLKKEMFGYLEGGYARIFSVLVEKLIDLGVEIHTGTPVQMLKSLDNQGVEITIRDKSINFDKCIVTLPSKQMRKICPDIEEDQLSKHENLTYLGVICVSVLLKNSITPFYVTNITDDWVPFTGVIEMSALVNKKHFNGNALIYLPKYVLSSSEQFKKTDTEISEEFINALLRMYPTIRNSDILNSAVARSYNVFALSTIGYSDKLPSVKTNTEGLYILNTAQITNGTLNVNETVHLAEKFVEKNFE